MCCGSRGVPTLLDGVGAASELSTASRRDDMACGRVLYVVCGLSSGVRVLARGFVNTRRVEVPGPCIVLRIDTPDAIIEASIHRTDDLQR
jgi:hypothetical protein